MVRAVVSGASAALFVLLLTVSPAVARQGNRICDLSLTDLEGKSVTLSELTGKVVVVNFWATWCDPCREEIPELVALYSEYRGRGLEIIGVSMDTGKEDRVKAFAKKFGIEYPIVIGDIQLAHKWLVRGIPRTIIIDQGGTVTREIAGVIDKRSLETDIRPLLGIVPTEKR